MRPTLFALACLLVGSLVLGMEVPERPTVGTAASHRVVRVVDGLPPGK